jgi:prevent-host-death family protein
MQRVGAREFKNRFGRYLRSVRQGKTLVLTLRGTPVAKVIPAESGEPEGADVWARLEELEAEGIVRIGRGKLKPFSPVKNTGKPGSQIIIEDRR